VIGYFVGDQPVRKCVAHTVVRSRIFLLSCWVGCLWQGFFVHGGVGGGSQHIALGDWQTDLYNCTLILSQAVGFTIFPHSHVHGPARDLNRSTPLVCGWDGASSAMLSPYVLWLTFLGTVVFWFSKLCQFKHIETLREKESVCACA